MWYGSMDPDPNQNVSITKPVNLLPHVVAGVGAAALVCEYGLEAVVTAGVGASVPGEPPLLHLTLSQVLQLTDLKPCCQRIHIR